MGFFYWLLKNGPGSVGFLTKNLCKNFLEMKTHSSDEEKIFMTMLSIRFPNMNHFALVRAVALAEGELSLVNFNIVVYENLNKLDHLQNSLAEVIKVVYEVTSKRAENHVHIDYETYREKAMSNFGRIAHNL